MGTERGRVFARAVPCLRSGEAFGGKWVGPIITQLVITASCEGMLCRAPDGRHASWEEPSPTDGFTAGRAGPGVCFGLRT